MRARNRKNQRLTLKTRHVIVLYPKKKKMIGNEIKCVKHTNYLRIY